MCVVGGMCERMREEKRRKSVWVRERERERERDLFWFAPAPLQKCSHPKFLFWWIYTRNFTPRNVSRVYKASGLHNVMSRPYLKIYFQTKLTFWKITFSCLQKPHADNFSVRRTNLRCYQFSNICAYVKVLKSTRRNKEEIEFFFFIEYIRKKIGEPWNTYVGKQAFNTFNSSWLGRQTFHNSLVCSYVNFFLHHSISTHMYLFVDHFLFH